MFEAALSRILAALLFLGSAGSSVAALQITDLFVAGKDGYHTYRIPVLLNAGQDTILAFCEGRKNGAGDSGSIDLLLKRSTDGGKTWSPQQVVWSDAANVCGNPAPVLDRSTGTIWLLMNWNRGSENERKIMEGTSLAGRHVFVTSSTNQGKTWSSPRDITTQVKKPHWRWYATGPANGIQLTRGLHKGRLLIPANHSDHSDTSVHPYRSHAIYSDDHGETWQIGGIEEPMTNESCLVELSDGSVLQNMRSYHGVRLHHGANRRAVAHSHDGGESWSAITLDQALIEPICQASILRVSWPEEHKPGQILFANPASLKRELLTIRVSTDDAATWAASRVLFTGPSAYSSLAVLPDNTVACAFECGEKSPYEKIALARFRIDWISDK